MQFNITMSTLRFSLQERLAFLRGIQQECMLNAPISPNSLFVQLQSYSLLEGFSSPSHLKSSFALGDMNSLLSACLSWGHMVNLGLYRKVWAPAYLYTIKSSFLQGDLTGITFLASLREWNILTKFSPCIQELSGIFTTLYLDVLIYLN